MRVPLIKQKPGGQSRTMSMVETVTNTVIGYLVALLTQLVVFPLVGVSVSLSQNIGISLVFTAVSIVRGFLLRRFFNAIR